MEIDELKAGWALLDQRLEQLDQRMATLQSTLSVAVSDQRRRGVQAELRPLVVGQVLQLVAGAAFAVAGGSFWVHHLHAPTLFVTGLLLHAYGLAAIVAAARNLFLVHRLHEAAPVLELQRRIATLRAWRIAEGRWFGVAGCFMWVATVVWGFGMAGVDVVSANPAFVALNLLAGIVCLGVFVVASRRDRSPEGTSVRRARERLDEISQFEAP